MIRQRNRSLLQRIEDNCIPEPNSGCWLWLGATQKGYGAIRISGKTARAYRVSYELLIGPIPATLELDHKCKVKCCVNPQHLEPVTHQINMLRAGAGLKTGATRKAKTHCASGHLYDEANTYFDRNGHRVCRSCKRDWWRRNNGDKPCG